MSDVCGAALAEHAIWNCAMRCAAGCARYGAFRRARARLTAQRRAPARHARGARPARRADDPELRQLREARLARGAAGSARYLDL